VVFVAESPCFAALLLWLQLESNINGIKNSEVEKRMFFNFIKKVV